MRVPAFSGLSARIVQEAGFKGIVCADLQSAVSASHGTRCRHLGIGTVDLCADGCA